MRRNFYTSLLLTSTFLFFLSAPALAGSGWADGKVVNSQTLNGIADADIYVVRITEGDTVYTTTNDTGYYCAEVTTAPDTFKVFAKAFGYWPDQSNLIPILEGDTTEVNFELDGPRLQNFDSSLVEDDLCEGDSSATQREIYNLGAGTFKYWVEEDADWIDVVPDSGRVRFLGRDTLNIWLYALSGNVGIFEDTITIIDAVGPEIHIPVRLGSYDADPYLDVDSSPIYDTLAHGEISRYDRTMTNLGCQNLTFTASKDEDWISVAPTSGTIPMMGGTRDLTIVLTGPEDPGSYTGHVTIDSNDPNNPQVVIDIYLEVPAEGVEDETGSKLPSTFALRPCYPNPFNTSTTISYDLPIASGVRLEVYNLVGQKVVTLVDGHESAGYKSITWNGAEVTTGIYYYKLSAGDFVSVRKLTILK